MHLRFPHSSTKEAAIREVRLCLYHTHTAERIDVVYRRGGDYVPEALSSLDKFLRDHRTGEVHHFDPRLFDLLSDLTRAVGRPDAEINIICGYRTPWSNNYLRHRSSGVAQNSLHMQAEAIDIRLPGTKTSQFHQAAVALQRGGVGYYPRSDFVHVDIGGIRYWYPSIGIRIPPRQQFFQRCVVPIDISQEPHLATLGRDGSAINYQNRNRTVEIHLDGLGAVHRIADTLASPLGLVSKNPDRKLLRSLEREYSRG